MVEDTPTVLRGSIGSLWNASDMPRLFSRHKRRLWLGHATLGRGVVGECLVNSTDMSVEYTLSRLSCMDASKNVAIGYVVPA